MGKTFIAFLAVLAMGVMSTGCDDGAKPGNGAGVPSQSAVRTISKSELAVDLQAVNAGEASLEQAGLGFRVSTRHGVTTYRWDTWVARHTYGVTVSDQIAALQNYLNVANNYLAKYSGNFLIEGEDQSNVYMATNIDSIRAKRDLSQKTLDELSRAP